MRAVFTLFSFLAAGTSALAAHVFMLNGHPVAEEALTGERFRKEVVRIECRMPGGVRFSGNAEPYLTAGMTSDQRKKEMASFRDLVASELPLLQDLEKLSSEGILSTDKGIESIVFSRHAKTAFQGPDKSGRMTINPELALRPGQLAQYLSSVPSAETRFAAQREIDRRTLELQAKHGVEVRFDAFSDPAKNLPAVENFLNSVDLSDRKVRGILVTDGSLYVSSQQLLHLDRGNPQQWPTDAKSAHPLTSADRAAQKAETDYLSALSRLKATTGLDIEISASNAADRSRTLASLDPLVRKYPKGEKVWVLPKDKPLVTAKMTMLPAKASTKDWEATLAAVPTREQWTQHRAIEAKKRCEVMDALGISRAVAYNTTDRAALLDTYDRLIALGKKGYRLAPRFSMVLVSPDVTTARGRNGHNDGTLVIPDTGNLTAEALQKYFVKAK
ncbi:hypothetical protein K2X33_07180 [bacterium]|nr:hypothetical protein [bacterium]